MLHCLIKGDLQGGLSAAKISPPYEIRNICWTQKQYKLQTLNTFSSQYKL